MNGVQLPERAFALVVDPRGCYSNSLQSLEAQLQSLLNDMGLLA